MTITLRRDGTPLVHTPATLMARVTQGDGCWTWNGAISNVGYAKVGYQGEQWYAHRLIYTLLRGPIAADRELDHLCRNRACVNPDHLEAVTGRVNNLRGFSPAAKHARQTHCIRGHALDESNSYHRPDKPWHRNCRVCARARDAARRPRR